MRIFTTTLPRVVAIVQTGYLFILGLLGWSIICAVPALDWNSARLLPAALLSAGHTIYFSPGEGPAIGWSKSKFVAYPSGMPDHNFVNLLPGFDHSIQLPNFTLFFASSREAQKISKK